MDETNTVQYKQSESSNMVRRTLDLKKTTKFVGSKGISPATVNGIVSAASKAVSCCPVG